MDAMEKIANDCKPAMAVLGRAGDYVVVDLAAPSQAAIDFAKEKQFCYCGVVGLENGQLRADCVKDLDAACIMLKAIAWFASPKVAPQGDAVGWLERLWNLPEDPRAE